MNYHDMTNEVLYHRGRDIIFKWQKSLVWMNKNKDSVDNYEAKYNAKQNQIELLSEILSRLDRSVDGRNKDDE